MHSLLAQIPRAMAAASCAGDTGTGTALQPQSGAFCQLQPDSRLPCCNVCASCKQPVLLYTRSIIVVAGGIVRNDLRHSQSTVMEISTLQVFFPQEALDSLRMDLFFLYIITSNVVLLEEVATCCSYTLCFHKTQILI